MFDKIKSLFEKKPKSLKEVLEYLDKNVRLSFQLDMVAQIKKNNFLRADIQLFRPEVALDFNVEIKKESQYLIMISFNSEKYDNKKNHNNFCQNSLVEEAVEVDFYGVTYLLFCMDSSEVLSKMKILEEDVFEYNNKDFFVFTKFKKLGKRRGQYKL